MNAKALILFVSLLMAVNAVFGQSQSLRTLFTDLDATMEGKGYSRDFEVIFRNLAAGKINSHDINLDKGTKYAIVVITDTDKRCGDVDVKVYDPEEYLLKADDSERYFSTINIEPEVSGFHSIDLSVYDCAVNQTTYGLAVFSIAPKVLACGYFGVEAIEFKDYPTTNSFTNVSEAEQIAERIVSKVGLKSNFIIRVDNQVPNAAALIRNDQRYILYNVNFIREARQRTGSEWGAIGILAHEIGHHLNAHTLGREGSMPPKELDADEFSGFAMAKMGATLEQATMGVRIFGSEAATRTHPGKRDRIAAITKGWNEAKAGMSPTPNPVRPNTADVVQPTIPVNPSNQPVPVLQCFFINDANQYFVMNNNAILAKNMMTGQVFQVGYLEASQDPNFQFIYVLPQIRYGIDFHGKIWGPNYLGQLVIIGHVVNL